MHRRLLPLLLMTALLAGCLSDGDDPDGPSEPVGAAGPLVFSGAVNFGENTTSGTGASTPSGFGAPTTSYVSSYGPEPNIGVTSSGAVFTTAFSTVMRSMDGGDTWEGVHTHDPVPGSPVGTNNDPMLWVDAWTDTVYSAPMFPILLCASIYASTDDGTTWSGPVPACGTGAFDHQKLASGPPGRDTNPLAGVLHPTVLYVCYNGVAVTNCMASYDGGTTWPVDEPTSVNTVGFVSGAGGIPTPVEQMTDCLSGQNGHPTVSYQGVAAFLRTWSCEQPLLTYSTDSGLSWTTVPGPEFPGGPSDILGGDIHSIDPEVAFTPDGTMYVLFQSHDHHAYLARTSDLGATWDGPWDVTPPGVGSTAFAALAAGDDGRIAAAFVGTRDGTGSSASIGPDARWHLWMVTSEDAAAETPSGPTFVAYQATPEDDPVQIGEIHQGGGTDPDRNLLDFIDGAVAPDGTFYVAYTDGCSIYNECSGLPPEEQTSAFRGGAGAVAWLDGWSLLAEPRDGPLPL